MEHVCKEWFGSLALAGSALLKHRNHEMNATAVVMGVPLVMNTVSRLL